MFTIFATGVLIFIICFTYNRKTYSDNALVFGLLMVYACCGLAMISNGHSLTTVSEDFIEIKSISYITETGATKTLEGTYYTKDGVYYVQDMTRANWIPFAPCDFTEVDLPKTTTAAKTD